MSLLVNGVAYSYGDIDIQTLPGINQFFQSIDWDLTHKKKLVHGKGAIALGESRGGIEVSGTMSILLDGHKLAETGAALMGYMLTTLPPFPVVVSYATDGVPTAIDVLKNLSIDSIKTSNGKAGSEEAATRTYGFIATLVEGVGV